MQTLNPGILGVATVDARSAENKSLDLLNWRALDSEPFSGP